LEHNRSNQVENPKHYKKYFYLLVLGFQFQWEPKMFKENHWTLQDIIRAKKTKKRAVIIILPIYYSFILLKKLQNGGFFPLVDYATYGH
jgi:hypothetical protein